LGLAADFCFFDGEVIPLPTRLPAGDNYYPDEYENKPNKVSNGNYFSHGRNTYYDFDKP
jgi:hypothetical protein